MATNDRTLNANLSTDTKHKATQLRVALVVSQWNSEITEGLFNGAKQTLLTNGLTLENVRRYDVPGSFELIYGAKKLIQAEQYDAVIVIGSVIRGETAHFHFVCGGVTQGIVDLNIKYNTPVIFCVLTDETRQQGIDRSGGKLGNKGDEAAIAAIQMALFNA